MSDLESRIAGLSPAKRALLERWWSDKVATDEADPIRPRPPDANLPLSFSQQRLWFLDQWEPGNPAYNSFRVFELEGPLDITALQCALTEISSRHESLRTTFSSGPDGPVQIVHPPGEFEIRRFHLAAGTDEKKWAEALNLAEQETARPFSLATGPLLRASLLDLQPQRYLLVLTIHHIISDGWSMGVLYQELFTLYEEFVNKGSCSLPDLPIQYADFAIWQRRRLQGEFLRTQLSYWQEQLRDLPTLELATDHARPAIQTFSGAIHHIHLPQHVLDGLLLISRRQGATLFLTLLAGFQVLLHRYTGQNDIAVGSPIAGRTHVELERLIGCFVNMLVLRGDISGNPTFIELLKRVEKIAFEAYSHQVIPFERLVEEFHPRRDASRNPLFQVAFALQNAPRPVVSLSRLKVTPVQVAKSPIRFDLEVHIRELDGLDGLFIYNTALFRPETIARMAQHYRSVLEGIVANPDQRVSELPLLVETERQQMLVEWNQTDSNYPRDVCIQTLFEARAQASPAAVAIVWGKTTLTYRQVNEQANSLAKYLCDFGVGPDTLVAVCLERSIEMIVACLAILKAGGAYVPLEPSYPRERLAFMLRDANAPVVITTVRLRAILPETTARIVYLDKQHFSRGNPSNPNSGATADNLAYVMYTSGSTGQPKGVSVSHRAVVRLVVNSNYVQLSTADRIAQASNVTFDAATFEIWGALLNGATLIGVPQSVLLSPKNLAKLIRSEGITILFLTTALFNEVASESPTAFRALRYLLFGGQSADPKWVKVILDHGPPQNLLNVYGPTECTTFTTSYRVERVDDSARTIPIGRPISGTRVYILDSHLRPVPAGVAGELYIGGDGLAREYLNRPELTAESFISAPFSEAMPGRIYKTGDFARYLPDGNIEFIGRIDRQVKIRGFRIELQEIEAVLSQHAGVGKSVVIAKQKDKSDQRLYAYIVPDDGQWPGTETLRRYLRDKLPEYMLPAAFVILDSLPLSPNGKVDHTRLPEPAEIGADDAIETTGPRTWIEAALAGIWTELLGLKVVSVHANFFDLGGHSLLAVQLIARIEKRFGKTVPVSILFRSPTIAQLADILSTQDDAEAWPSLIAIQPNGRRTPFFWILGESSNVSLPALLGPDQPIYGFDHQGVDGRPAVHTEVDTMAEHYLNGLRALRPHGPYLLGGYSFGAVLAYEIAQRLRSVGEEVPLLFMLDPPGKTRQTVLKPPLRPDLRRHARELERLGAREALEYLLPRVKDQIYGRTGPIVETLRKVRWKFYLAAGLVVPAVLRGPYILDVYMQALRRYRPQPYSAPATLLRSKGGPYESPFDWPKLVSGDLDIYEVSGGHMDLRKAPYVKQWAAHLCKSLERAHQSCANGKV
jgi:amino acid adenylation domain-containing protein